MVGEDSEVVCTYGIDVCETGRDLVFGVDVTGDATEEVVIGTVVVEGAEAVVTVLGQSVEIGGTGSPTKFTIMETGP